MIVGVGERTEFILADMRARCGLSARVYEVKEVNEGQGRKTWEDGRRKRDEGR